MFSLKVQHYIGPVCLTANVGLCVEWVVVNGVLVGGWFALGGGEGEWSGKCIFFRSDIDRFSSVSGGLFVKATGALGLRSEAE